MSTQTTPLADRQHVSILMAYVSRLTERDAERILDGVRECWYASRNLGNRSQLDAHYALEAILQEALGRMIEHDKQLITMAIDRACLAGR